MHADENSSEMSLVPNPRLSVFICGQVSALGGLFGVNHPRDAELIDAHPKAWRPEGLLERHFHSFVLSQSFKDPLTFGAVLQMDRDIRPFGLLITSRRGISAHQYLVA